MARKADPASDFEHDILKVFRSDRVDEHQTIDLMTIVWKRSGKPVLEKRRVWHSATKGKRLRKLVGMTVDDVRFIVEHSGEILESFR